MFKYNLQYNNIIYNIQLNVIKMSIDTEEHSYEYLDGWKRGWIEAVIDSEGCIFLVRYKRSYQDWYNYQPTLSISNTSLEFLETFNDLVGDTGFINLQPSHENRKTCYRLMFSGYALRELLPNITLIVKEKQRLLLIEALKVLSTGGRGVHISKEYEEVLYEIYCKIRESNSGKGSILNDGSERKYNKRKDLKEVKKK